MGIEWFYNHPALRYGGYCIIALLFFIPVCLRLNSNNIDFKKYTKYVFILIIISISTFNLRNFSRILKEVNFYNYKPIKDSFYSLNSDHFRIQKQMNKYIVSYKDCEKLKNDCQINEEKITKKYNKIIFKY